MLYLIRNLPEIPAGTAAEIEARLERCGIDGLILEAIECRGKSEQSLEKHLNIPLWSIRKRAKKALRKVSSMSVSESKRFQLVYIELIYRARRI